MDSCQRIVCLTEEPTETLYLLGEQHRIVGITMYTVRPPEARAEKPVVSAFVSGSVQKILDLKPDLVLGFSDVQAKFAAKLIQAGLQVLIFNQRSLEEILGVILTLGRLVSAEEKSLDLVADLRRRIESARRQSVAWERRPTVYFEEWFDPQISAIRWVSELIHIAGGRDVFADRSTGAAAAARTVQPDEVLSADPDVVMASWCGKPFDRDAMLARPGWGDLRAVRENAIHEIDSAIILQPGPACILDGLPTIQEHLAAAARSAS